MSPYWDANFGQTFFLLLSRLLSFFWDPTLLATLQQDEIECIALILVGLSSIISGTFLTLKRSVLIVNSIAHTILLGLMIVILFILPEGSLWIDMKVTLTAALFSALGTLLTTHFFVQCVKIQEEAAVAFVFTSFFALGVLLSSLYARNSHLGVEAIMGHIDAVEVSDLKPLFLLFLLNLVCVVWNFKDYLLFSFDPLFGRSIGRPNGWLLFLLSLQCTWTIIGGFQVAGVVLILPYFLLPMYIARHFIVNVKGILLLSSGVVFLNGLLTVSLSRHILSTFQLPVSSSAMAVLTLFAFFWATEPFRSMSQERTQDLS